MIDNEFYRRCLFGEREELISHNIFEVTSFYHAMRVKKYIGIISEIMKDELYLLQEEDEIILNIEPSKSDTVFDESSMGLYTHSIMSLTGRLPMPKKYEDSAYAGKRLFDAQVDCVYKKVDEKKWLNVFNHTWWGQDDELYAMHTALKSCMSILMHKLIDNGDLDDTVSVKDMWQIIDSVIEDNSKGLPQRNPEFDEGKTSELALDAISNFYGEENFIENAVQQICDAYNINIEQ